MKRKCAYCKKEGKLTKEHIWSKCLLKRMPELEIKFLDSKNISFNSEMVISDVCADCNNNRLSPIDAYFCNLYDSYFKNYYDKKIPIKFEYDYDLLLRSLLKITYNSSRTHNKTKNFFSRFKQCILNGQENREDVLIKLDLVLPTESNGRKIYPKSARSARVHYNKEAIEDELFIVRLISVNSYYFYIIISKEVKFTDEKTEAELMNILKIIPGTIVNPYNKFIVVDEISGKQTLETLIGFVNQIENSKKVFKK